MQYRIGIVLLTALLSTEMLVAQSKGKKKGQDEPEAPKQTTEAPASVDSRTYVLGPEDVLDVRVWRQQDLTSRYAIRPDGKFTMPLIGELQAAGRTPEDLGKEVAKRLGEFINNPDVVISVFEVRSKKFNITGEVNKPGTFPLLGNMRVLDALSLAGGFRDFANTKKIRILRSGKVIYFNFNEVSKGKKMEQNVPVENGDYIIVP